MSNASHKTIVIDCLGVRIGKQRGAERYICGLILELAALRRRDFLLLVNKTWVEFLKDVLPPSQYVVVPIFSENRVFRMLVQMIYGPLVCRRYKASLYISTAVFPTLAFPCATVAFVHDVMLLHFPKEYSRTSWLVRMAILKASVPTLSAIFTSSQASADDIGNRFKKPAGFFHVVPGGSPERIAQPASPEHEKQILSGLSLGGRKFALSVLGAGEYKNPRGLAEAAKKLREWGREDIDIIVVGDAARTLKSIQHDALLRPLGFVSDETLAVLYANAKALVYPTFFEGFGLPVVEAQASGLPVICSNLDVLKEVGGNGTEQIDPHNPATIAYAILEVVDSLEKRSGLIQRGKKNAAMFTWARAVERFNAACAAVISKNDG